MSKNRRKIIVDWRKLSLDDQFWYIRQIYFWAMSGPQNVAKPEKTSLFALLSTILERELSTVTSVCLHIASVKARTKRRKWTELNWTDMV